MTDARGGEEWSSCVCGKVLSEELKERDRKDHKNMEGFKTAAPSKEDRQHSY